MQLFPAEFVMGAASAAYQIEGAFDADGKGRSIWDDFVSHRGNVRNGDTGMIACDHYRRWEEDLDLAAAMELQAYRFSISWPRVLPEGRGQINQAGLDFYSRLVDGLLSRGIQPVPTLFHWDLPSRLQRDMGGFANRAIVPIFADYASIVSKALGDRVKTWITVNEPFEFSCFGHLFGTHAPGRKNPFIYLPVIHHVLLAHGMAMAAVRAELADARIGPSLSWTPVHPASPSAHDMAAAERANAFMNGVTFDPILKGAYPRMICDRLILKPPVRPGDMEIIARPVDFVGLNYYSREFARNNPWVPLVKADVSGKETRDVPETDQRTAMGWEVYHEGMSEVLASLREEYGNPPVYVTEFGSAWTDSVDDGPEGRRVADHRRVDFLAGELGSMLNAIEKGSDLRGCFVWSLTDNFEWAEGFSKRFGLIHVDYKTQKRTMKDSGLAYARLIATRDLQQVRGAL
ncbi:MAG: GH1 family beta-glucosidase [Spirochaetia bacterium]|jgi:beta-glucosidase|nr:GH1 family beta-glucosidase [Spirochaetia bacterium]